MSTTSRAHPACAARSSSPAAAIPSLRCSAIGRVTSPPLARTRADPILVGLEGRLPVQFFTRDGRVVHSMEVARLVRPFPLFQFRLHQEADGSFHFGYLGPVEPETMRDALAELLGTAQSIRVDHLPEFAGDPQGPGILVGFREPHGEPIPGVIVSTLEVLAVILGLACVGLTVRQHVACWPTGLAMVVLYIVVFYRARLYSDMLLQVVYIVLQLYGWHAWVKGGPRRSGLAVSRLPCHAAVAWVDRLPRRDRGAGHRHAPADRCGPAVSRCVRHNASLIAQWLLGRKVLESWLVWIVVDVFSIGMYLMKDLYLTAALYAVFLVLSVQGYRAWSRTRAVPAMG